MKEDFEGKSTGEDDINSELFKYGGENFHNIKLTLSNRTNEHTCQRNGRIALVCLCLKMGKSETQKIAAQFIC
jgi:hypothetical protein